MDSDRYMVYVIAGDSSPQVNICRLSDDKEELIASYSDASEILDDAGEAILVDSKVFHDCRK